MTEQNESGCFELLLQCGYLRMIVQRGCLWMVYRGMLKDDLTMGIALHNFRGGVWLCWLVSVVSDSPLERSTWSVRH